MNALSDGSQAAPAAETPPWTCPYCALLCDHAQVDLAAPPRLRGASCPRANGALAHLLPEGNPEATQAWVKGTRASVSEALDVAAQWMSQSRRPLLGGLATDVAGARALYRLAARTHAVADHAHGQGLHNAVRAQQDKGTFYTTLSEVLNRCDLLVCVGTQPAARYPLFYERCGIGRTDLPQRHVVYLGTDVDPALPQSAHVRGEAQAVGAPLARTLSELTACVRGHVGADARVATWQPLVDQLRAARYPVLVWEPGMVGPHGELVGEALYRLVAELNAQGRATTLSLGGSEGAYAVNQAWTWLSGLPLRTEQGPAGLNHDPVRLAGSRLLAQGEVDLLLWVASFQPGLIPPDTGLPQIILGRPGLVRPEGDVVFIPVATPGIESGGHLFRADGGVVLPLRPIRPSSLPTVAEVIEGLLQRLEAHTGAPA